MLLPLGEGAKTVNRFSIHKTALAIQGRKPDAVKCRYRCCANSSSCFHILRGEILAELGYIESALVWVSGKTCSFSAFFEHRYGILPTFAVG